MSRVTSPHRQPWIVRALLLALLVRALIPAGFMPAADFSFQICPDGFPAHMLRVAAAAPHGAAGEASAHSTHHHHAKAGHAESGAADTGHHAGSGAHHDSARSQDDGTPHRHAAAGMEHCTFAAAAGPALLAWTPSFSAPATLAQAPDFVYVAPTLKLLRFRVQQPRGPPALA